MAGLAAFSRSGVQPYPGRCRQRCVRTGEPSSRDRRDQSSFAARYAWVGAGPLACAAPEKNSITCRPLPVLIGSASLIDSRGPPAPTPDPSTPGGAAAPRTQATLPLARRALGDSTWTKHEQECACPRGHLLPSFRDWLRTSRYQQVTSGAVRGSGGRKWPPLNVKLWLGGGHARSSAAPSRGPPCDILAAGGPSTAVKAITGLRTAALMPSQENACPT